MSKIIVVPDEKTPADVVKKAEEFVTILKPYEFTKEVHHVLFADKKSKAYYIICHLPADTIAAKADLEAVLDPEESEDYKLNRDLYLDTSAYRLMESDAVNGRSFEDIVVEYDTSYRHEKPLKVYGGQHRVQAIRVAVKNGVILPHGVRVYFLLSVDQKYDIAIANNTSIAVANDLLDRMQEELLGNELREWCQEVGLLAKGQNFADRRSPEGIPSVRIARTLIVNYYDGKKADKDAFHMPIVCTSGSGMDKHYTSVRSEVDWADADLKEMGQEFVKLHRAQREKVLTRKKNRFLEFANKAIHPTVAASWAYAAGLFQNDKTALEAHYALSMVGGQEGDTLNASALKDARIKGTDPDTYRGIGARISNDELGRMFAVFLLQATKASKRGINLKIANAAIMAYIAAERKAQADKALKGI